MENLECKIYYEKQAGDKNVVVMYLSETKLNEKDTLPERYVLTTTVSKGNDMFIINGYENVMKLFNSINENTTEKELEEWGLVYGS